MKHDGALQTFQSIEPGDPDEPHVLFEDVSLMSLWGRNLVFDIDGEPVPLPGPIHTADRSSVAGGRRRKIRFVLVSFFFYTRAQNYSTNPPESRLFAQAYAWQGENNLIHLLERMTLLDSDPMGDAASRVEMDALHLEDRLRDHAEQLEEKIGKEEARIHQNSFGMEEPQDLLG